MGRPSLQEQRTAEILTAYEICVARHGLDGATQERIAAEAGVKRTLLRHYLGNKDEMVEALIKHVVARFNSETDQMIAALPKKDRPKALLDILFGPLGVSETASVLTINALGAASDRFPKARAGLLEAIGRMHDAVAQELIRDYPSADETACRVAAFGICHLYFSIDSLMMLAPPKHWLDQARLAADVHLLKLEGSRT
ncbi:MAG: TetR/AcrR family transcriptional regulator [Rhodobiaceae bacterium]|nr:TetR/AcrR family transcriptional regulator [Rhodobiaceae bacterium]